MTYRALTCSVRADSLAPDWKKDRGKGKRRKTEEDSIYTPPEQGARKKGAVAALDEV